MPVDEMIIASINCLDEIEEHFKTQMIAWVRCAADFGEINDQLVKENAELKEKVSYLEDNLRVARKDRDNLQLDVAKGLKEFVKDYPATSLRYLANEKYVEQLTKAKELIEELISSLSVVGECEEEECELLNRAEQFLKDSIE